MIGSIVCLLVTDFVYGLMILHGTYDHQLWLDAGWIGFYVLWGAAALHPSMRTLTRPAERESVLTRFRLGLLTTRLADRADARPRPRPAATATSTWPSSARRRSCCSGS